MIRLGGVVVSWWCELGRGMEEFGDAVGSDSELEMGRCDGLMVACGDGGCCDGAGATWLGFTVKHGMASIERCGGGETTVAESGGLGLFGWVDAGLDEVRRRDLRELRARFV
jgi:hypothetical protein